MSAKIVIKTTDRVVPMIYAYTTPEIARHNGWTKIGYTEQDVDKRLSQQTHTADVEYKEEWRGNATFEDGSGDTFTDKDFHRYLRKLNIENDPKNEWFHVTGPVSRNHFYDFRANRGILQSLTAATPYNLREEQEEAVEKTLDYSRLHTQGEYLWNAKPRFGKTLTAYELCKQMNANTVLIVTNRPAIANSWYSDYEKFLGPDSGYLFVSDTSSLQGKPFVVTRKQYLDMLNNGDYKCIEFVSLQDLKGSIYFGGEFEKLKEVNDIHWDVLIIDEAHEGVDTYKTDVAFDHIERNFTLHLSGTPFKAIASEKFKEDAIYNWTYADEQKKKRDWQGDQSEQNPYANLPQLNMFTYQMSEVVRDELKQGIEINGETEEWAFDLNEFFAVNQAGNFVHDSAVDKFLDALTTQTKFPFSTPELRDELKHTLWLLNRVDSAKALARKLNNHPVFKDYKVVAAVGDGRLNDDDSAKKAFDSVTEAIAQNDKTITLSVGQLTTGVTIPEWTAVLMLSSIKSASLYMQAAFRAQNPCLFRDKGKFYRKENAYIFDFDPARTLMIFEEFANDLYASTSDGRGDTETRKKHIKELLNFFPVIGEDEDGEMVELDAEKVLSIPRKIRSTEVVNRGFMSNYLFQNISNIFGAPQAVVDIITKFTPVDEPKKQEVKKEDLDRVHVDENGDVKVDEGYVIGLADDIFGDKIYETVGEQVTRAIDKVAVDNQPKDKALEALQEAFKAQAVKPIVAAATSNYGTEIKASDAKRVEKKLGEDADRLVARTYGDYRIETNQIEKERHEQLAAAAPHEQAKINQEFDQKKAEATEKLKTALNDTVSSFVEDAAKETVRSYETQIEERKKNDVEDTIRDHLRGFARTIPSFLMAYGTEDTTLANFDQIVPDEVFQEVTSITLEQFRFLRDGGDYEDTATGETKHFDGKLFDKVVFDDSIKEFLRLKHELANYFDPANEKDIFDYIPPQRTNQIFTPKATVAKMVSLLEEENPGCFDDPDKTFIDLYMKSGLYITEIVKRLYQSEGMKTAFPNPKERLEHIFEKQVYGLAPSEIIYRIATNYILGFSEEHNGKQYNFRMCDALPYTKDGTLSEKLDELFG